MQVPVVNTSFPFFSSQGISRGSMRVIVGSKVVGDYASNEEALIEAKKTYKLGDFLIQKCTEGDSAYTYTFHSRVRFNHVNA